MNPITECSPTRNPKEKGSRFEGGVLMFILYVLLYMLVLAITVGLAVPWVETAMQRWICRNTIIDGRRLYFDGTGLQLFGSYIKWWFFTLITFGIYSLWLFNKMQQWKTKHTHFE